MVKGVPKPGFDIDLVRSGYQHCRGNAESRRTGVLLAYGYMLGARMEELAGALAATILLEWPDTDTSGLLGLALPKPHDP